ncbi:MAG: DEAD/DEAH box helicase [Cenarchaeum symbiont of Oopsacas minuta]|nr:DEAD/DEAH box helicase [Cenarchaeum symbiont of Oopsacas minuta]
MQKQTTTKKALETEFRLHGFKDLTIIQKKASPEIFLKKDSLVMAPTGSGKTECSIIPIFAHIRNSAKGDGRIKAMYITPLRALNRDIFRRISDYAKRDDLSMEIRHGDTPQSARRRITLSPPDVLVTTPESLVILLSQSKMLDALSQLEWVVIDEVHELLSNKRGSQLAISLERLSVNTRKDLTRIGLSATVGNPVEASKFISGSHRSCKIIQDTSVRGYDIDVQYVDGKIQAIAEFILEYVQKLDLKAPVLLFTNTRGESELLASILKENSEIPVDLHHGSLSKEVRQEVESCLQSNKTGITVCTSSLELGLDVGSVELVIHYGSPRQVSKLVQRIGRSRHNRNSSARGLVIVNSYDDELEVRAILSRVQERSMEEQRVHQMPLDVVAHHLVGLSIQFGEITVKRTFDIISAAYPFRLIKKEDVYAVLDMLDASYLVYFDRDNDLYRRGGRSFRYHYENLSTIPDILRFKVFDTVGKRPIGSLDQRFIGDYGECGNVFVLKGSHWRILNIDEKGFTVNVEPYRAGTTTVPYWEGEIIPVDLYTANKVGNLRKNSTFASKKTLPDFLLDDIPDATTFLAESHRSEGTVVLHSCFGTRINNTLSSLLSSLLSAMLGYMVESRSDAYRIVFSSNSRLTEKLLIKVLYEKYDLDEVIAASLSGTHNVNWKTWCVCKKFGIVGRNAIYERKSARFLYERYSKTPIVQEALREMYHDKFDIPGTTKIIEMMRLGKINFVWHDVKKFSLLAEPILDHVSKYYSAPANVDTAILDQIKKRLKKTMHRLICARCGKWERSFDLVSISQSVKLFCPYCKCRQITTTFQSDADLSKIIKKKHMGKRLTADESHRYERAWKASSLVENFGTTALTVLSGYGIGPDTAARILRNMVDEDGDGLYKQIYEAERQYVMTRGFWDD